MNAQGRYAEPTPVSVPCRALPFVTGSLPRAPAIFGSRAALTAHDRYAGLLGLLPRGWPVACLRAELEVSLSVCCGTRWRYAHGSVSLVLKVFRAADAKEGVARKAQRSTSLGVARREGFGGLLQVARGDGEALCGPV